MTAETGSRAFVLRLGLGPVPASRAEVLTELGDRLDPYGPVLSQTATELEVRLTVVAHDLWLAVLIAMAALTDVGYPVVRLQAQPVVRPIRRPR